MRRFLTLLAVTAGLVVGFGWHAPVAHAADCDDNAIIKCGFEGASPSSINQHFINIVKSNDSNNGFHDLISVYDNYGLDSAKYNDFVSYARQGKTYKNGTIVVDGRTVATDANSIGRLKSYQGSGPFSKTIAGHTYWGNTNNQAFLSDPLPVTVLFDNTGKAIFAVINSCGNPMGFNAVTPTYTCTNLQADQVSGQPGLVNFKTNAKAANGAVIQKIVYTFGDGSAPVTSTNINQVIQHKYLTSNHFHASVKVYVSLPFGHSDIIDGATTGCDHIVDIQLPAYACVLLQAFPLEDKQFTYQFVVKSTTQFGASLGGATFDFGDKSKPQFAKAVNSNTVSLPAHQFKPGVWTVTATLLIYLPNNQHTTVTSSKCSVPVKVGDFGCVQLTYEQPDESVPLTYRFTAAGNATKGVVTFKTADFDFGDGATAKGVVPANLLAVATHPYATDGDYTITAVLHFNVNGVAKDDTCTAQITKQPPQECRPGVPVGSVLCNPCATNPNVPAGSSDCTTVLPNTGAGDVIAIAGVTALVGFFLYRQFVFRKHVFHSDNGTISMLLGESTPQHHAVKHEMATHNVHRNTQGLHHQANYHRPHRFRPRSHGDK